jgi:hypothetical protein
VKTTHAPREERLAAAETALGEIQRRLATLPPGPNWLEQIIGSCQDEPVFDGMIACGRAFRCGQVPGLQSEDWTV